MKKFNKGAICLVQGHNRLFCGAIDITKPVIVLKRDFFKPTRTCGVRYEVAYVVADLNKWCWGYVDSVHLKQIGVLKGKIPQVGGEVKL